MRKLKPELLDKMLRNPFYKVSCLSGKSNEKIELHHNLIFGGRQVNEEWCILPLLQSEHRDIVYNKERCDWIMYNRATSMELRNYSKAESLFVKRQWLNDKFGPWREDWYKFDPPDESPA